MPQYAGPLDQTAPTATAVDALTVPDQAARDDANNIAAMRVGSRVYVVADKAVYRLVSKSPATWVLDENTAWTRYVGAGSDINVYVEATGDDDAAGDSQASAWATTERVVQDLGRGRWTDKAVTVNYGPGTFRPPASVDIRATQNVGIVGVHWKGYRDAGQIYVPAGQTFALKAGFVTVAEATVAGGFAPDSDGYSHFGNLVLAGIDLASSVYPSTSPVLVVPNTYATSLDNFYPFTTFWDFGKTGGVVGFPASAGAIEQHMVTGIKFLGDTPVTAQGLACYGCASAVGQFRAVNCAFNNCSIQNLAILAGTRVVDCRCETVIVLDTGIGNTLARSFLDLQTNNPLVSIFSGASLDLTVACDFRNPDTGSRSTGIEISQHGYLNDNGAGSTYDGCQRAVVVDGGTYEVVSGADITGLVNGNGIELTNGGRALGVSGLSLTAVGSELVVGELAGQTFASVGAPGVSSPVLLCLATP